MPVGQQARGKGSWFESSDFQRWGWPLQEVNEDLVVFCSGANRSDSCHRSIGSAVKRSAVNREQVADRAQAFLKFRLNSSIRPRSDVEQEIPSTARNFDQTSNQKLCRFKVPIVDVVCPLVVDGHTGLPKLKFLGLWDHRLEFLVDAGVDALESHVLPSNPFRDELLRSLIIPRNADAIIHQRWRLQVSHEVDRTLRNGLLLVLQ